MNWKDGIAIGVGVGIGVVVGHALVGVAQQVLTSVRAPKQAA